MRILCIEDERRIADTIKKGLEQESYAVDVAYDGLIGYDMASTENYDIILLDRMLPSMDGMKICAELRKNHIFTPILMLTAKSQIQDKVDGLNIGADDYLAKPFSFDELIARIRALSRRPSKTLLAQLRLSDIEINTNNQVVKRKDKNVNLSKKEYAILEYFMRNPEKIISKQEIIDHVWNFDADILPNTVEVNIRNIRQKIGHHLIKTIRGFGYKTTS
ncbi:response regulator transcription factor [Candidatus Woesebacteria bacterium]|nr:response regulator transcription factor [Candidatus Woesebacteria bacterium]